MLLSDVCLSVTYIGHKSRTERPRKIKINTEVAHITRDSDTTFKVKRSKAKVTTLLCSLPCWRVRRLQRWAWERGGSWKLLLCCRLLHSARCFGAHVGGERRRHIMAAAHPQLVDINVNIKFCVSVMSHSQPTYVLEFCYAHIQLVQTLISTFLS